MKKVVVFSILAMGFSMSAVAALPPLYESINEYKTLLNDFHMTHKLESAELITSITRRDSEFVVETNKHRLTVKIISDPQNMPGPSKFHLEFGSPTNL